MEIKTRKQDKATIISVKGRMDAVTSPEFEKELSELMAGEAKDFIIDFSELDYISSAGLRSILATTKKLKEKEGKLMLSTLQEAVKEVFEISGFSSIIPICESIDSALSQM
ncbi:MAG: STAS domain-containing protein [Thermodesulfobacteriota bacterium]|nr:STAS domain-containing protein [Thermodesulfobacteriota bacterium]